MNARTAFGRYGEDLAARWLTHAGLTVIERNWRCRAGEIDIVAVDGDALVICEVKSRRARGVRRTRGAPPGTWAPQSTTHPGPLYEHPLAAVTPRKAERLRDLAERWLAQHETRPPGGVRIDAIGVLLPDRGPARLEHVRGIT
jgi:putative endonuclease